MSNYSVDLKIPAHMSNDFKESVLSHYFKADNPVLTHHKQTKDDGFRYYTFASDVYDDLLEIASLLPYGAYTTDIRSDV